MEPSETNDSGSTDRPDATRPPSFKQAPLANELLFDRYQVVCEIGRGGMGVVLLARDCELNLDVAIKLVPDLLVQDREGLDELKHEVLRGMALTHKNIVRTHGFARDAKMAAIIMEYVDGGNFIALKHAHPEGCLDTEKLLPWLEQLGPVLDYAHFEIKIAHRDLKPHNLMQTQSGRLKVADFGISSTLNDTVSRVSMQRASSGTPAYMSPQQVMGERPSHLDDVYALGATIYELLTGKPPFHKGHVLAQVLESQPVAMTARREEFGITGKESIPRHWEETVAACLSKEPQQRPQSVGEVIGRLKQSSTIYLSSKPLTAQSATQPVVASTRKKRQPPSTAAKWIAATVVAGLLTGGFALVENLKSPADKPPPAPPEIITPGVPAPLRITSPDELQSGRVGTLYGYGLTATGGRQPYGWSAENPLPNGLSLAENGIISGVPLVAGESLFGVRVNAGEGLIAHQLVKMVIHSDAEPPPIPMGSTGVPPDEDPPDSSPPPSVSSPAPLPKASKEFPYTNVLGMKFVPTGAPDILFSIWHTRVADFRAFVIATGHNAKKNVYSVRKGGKGEWELLRNHWEDPGFYQTDKHPVCGVSWEDASKFCEWLTAKEHHENKLPEGFVYRLPADAEWKTSFVIKDRPPNEPRIARFPWGTDWPPPLGYNFARSELPVGWSRLDGPPDDFPHTSMVDAFTPNRFGIHDVAGNLWQFCHDGPDPPGQTYWIRGGSWAESNKDRIDIDSQFSKRNPEARVVDAGFRCVIARKK